MIPSLTALVLGSFKALLLLAIAAAVTALLQRGPARLRVVVWATALAGSLLIPTVTPLLPRLELPVLPRIAAAIQPLAGESALRCLAYPDHLLHLATPRSRSSRHRSAQTRDLDISTGRPGWG